MQMTRLSVLLVLTFAWTACHRKGPSRTYSVNPGADSSITFDVPSDSASGAFRLPDTVLLRMDSTGKVSWSDSTRIRVIDLQEQLQDSLLAIYLHTRKLPPVLMVRYLGTVTMGIRGNVDDQIRQAQIVVRNVVAAKTLDRPFGKLDSTGQAAFEKKYPALFSRFY